MASRTGLNLLLLAAVIGLVWFARREPAPPPPPPAPVSGFTAAQIRQLRIERTGADAVVLVRREGRWHMQQPRAAPAAQAPVRSLVSLAAEQGARSFPAPQEGQALVQYGLAEPTVRLVVNNRVTLEFGAAAPLDRHRYVRVGDTIYLLRAFGFPYLKAAPEQLLSPQPAPPAP